MNIRNWFHLFCTLNIFVSTQLYASKVTTLEIEGYKFKVETLFEGSDVIWGFDFYPTSTKGDFDLLFSEREGKLKILDLKTQKVKTLIGVPKVFNESQGGLLDVLVTSDKTIYLTYADQVGKKATTSLFQGTLSPDQGTLNGKKIFEAQAFAGGGIHFGSRVLLDKEGKLFLSVGERNDRDKAQDLSTHNGKILRLERDGKPVATNPFVSTPKALPEIYSYGHRNPQGLAFLNDGRLINAEFGPRGGDEINLVMAGKNYGWPLVTYGKEYWGPSIGVKEKIGTEQPLKYWVPSISPSGLAIISQNNFPKLKGNLFLANLSGSHLRRLVLSDSLSVLKEEIFLTELEERFRQIKEAPNGVLYLSTDSGKILRLNPLP